MLSQYKDEQIVAAGNRANKPHSAAKLSLSLKPCGDCWLHIDAPSGKKSSINLGQRGGFNDQTIVGGVIREVAELQKD